MSLDYKGKRVTWILLLSVFYFSLCICSFNFTSLNYIPNVCLGDGIFPLHESMVLLKSALVVPKNTNRG